MISYATGFYSLQYKMLQDLNLYYSNSIWLLSAVLGKIGTG